MEDRRGTAYMLMVRKTNWGFRTESCTGRTFGSRFARPSFALRLFWCKYGAIIDSGGVQHRIKAFSYHSALIGSSGIEPRARSVALIWCYRSRIGIRRMLLAFRLSLQRTTARLMSHAVRAFNCSHHRTISGTSEKCGSESFHSGQGQIWT